jgi:hypothetical protein
VEVVVVMANMKVILGLMLLVGVVHGYTIDQPDSSWQFSDVANTAGGGDGQEGGHIVPDNGFQYHFDSYEGAGVSGNPQQFSQSSYVPEDTQEGSSFSDEAFVGDDAGALQNDPAPYDYNNSNGDEASFAVGVPEVRGTNPDYVYDASAGTGPDTTSFSSHGDEAVTSSDPEYVYDATTPKSEDGESFTALNTPPSADDQAVSSTGHSGPISYYTPASDPNGAFNFYDARSDEEKKTVTFTDDDSSDGSAVLTDHGDDTTASTSPVLAAYKPAKGTHGCPSNFWATHTQQWPKQIKITTKVYEAFGGVNLKKNLEIIYGTTTVFQALLDTRVDPYSKLLRNAVAALLNAYARPAFTMKPRQVSKLFHAALASKAAAAAQSQKFENENHAFGDSECK